MVFKGPSHYDCISRGMEAEEGRAEVQIILKDLWFFRCSIVYTTIRLYHIILHYYFGA